MVYSIPQPEMLNITSEEHSQDAVVSILSYSLEAWVIVISGLIEPATWCRSSMCSVDSSLVYKDIFQL